VVDLFWRDSATITATTQGTLRLPMTRLGGSGVKAKRRHHDGATHGGRLSAKFGSALRNAGVQTRERDEDSGQAMLNRFMTNCHDRHRSGFVAKVEGRRK